MFSYLFAFSFVIPAKAGISVRTLAETPAFAGVTG
jgi:hypothetical protein